MRKVLSVLLLAAVPLVFVGLPSPAEAASSKTKSTKSRGDYTPAERAKIMEMARKICTKKYGGPARVYRIDYKKKMVYCVPPGY